MEPPREFMERYLREKAQVQRQACQIYNSMEQQFYSPDYLKVFLQRRLRREQNPEQVTSVEVDNGCAKIITTGPALPKHYRYHLSQSGEGWQIDEVQWECLLCHGLGILNGKGCD